MRESLESYVARQLHVYEPDIFNETKDAELVKARQICMAMLREFTPKSLKAIGSRYGRDHTTVMYALKCVKKFSRIEEDYRELMMKVRDAINDGLVYLPFNEVPVVYPMCEECLIELQ